GEIRDLLADKGVVAELVPDSALIMSDIFPKEFLSKRDWLSRVRSCNGFNVKDYISFQGAKSLLFDHKKISEQLVRIAMEDGCSVLLVPIGRATGHEDHIVLEKVYFELEKKGVSCAIQDSEHVLDIMASIAFSKLYVGTSLHGAVTAYLFGSPVVGLMTNKVHKLGAYLDTWIRAGDYRKSNYLDFQDNVIALMGGNTTRDSIATLDAQKRMVMNSLLKYIKSLYMKTYVLFSPLFFLIF